MDSTCYNLECLSSKKKYDQIKKAHQKTEMLPDIQLDDIVRLRKPHPCGGYEWRIVRLGADIGLQCLVCGRRVLLSRRELAHRLKKVIPAHDIPPAQS